MSRVEIGRTIARPVLSTPQRGCATTRARFRLGSRGLVALCVLFTTLLRLPFLTEPLSPDEAGLLIIAQNWSEGPFLYGDYFIGRGIVLVLIYGLGDAIGGAVGVRLLACLFAALMVVAAGWAGHQLRGRTGAGWAALVAAAYSSTYAFSSEGMNGRLVAAALVMTGCALTLAAVRNPRSLVRSVLAGILVTVPLLVVQSYGDGLVFALVLLAGSWRARTLTAGDALRVAMGGLLGMLLTAAALALALATTWLTFEQLWFQSVGYRLEANHAVTVETDMPHERLEALVNVAALTGVWILLGFLFLAYWDVRRRNHLRPVWYAVVAMLAVTVVSMLGGGDWWADYLLQPIPALAMAAAVVIPSNTWSAIGMRTGVVLAAVAACVAPYLGLEQPLLGTPRNEAVVGRWIADSAEADDTAVVLWGKANVLHNAEMTSPYPYMWSLLTRTLDPQLTELLTIMRGPDAPTWVVEWSELDAWGLDEQGELAEVIRERYTYVGSPCGMSVYVLRGESRDVPPDDECRYLD